MPDFSIDIADAIATVTLRRGRKKNALTVDQVEALAPAVQALHDREDVNVLVLTGEGSSFSAGADLVANAAVLQSGEAGAHRMLDGVHGLLRAVWNFPRPSLAVLPGDAVGFGMDLALACDLRIAASSARLSQGFSKIALVPDGGSSLTLARLAGLGNAYELFYFSELVSADRALGLGLLNRVVPDAELAALATEWAARLAAGPAKALRLGKANLRAGLGDVMEAALAREKAAQIQCLSGPDPLAGMMAWMQGEPPRFSER